MRDIKWVGNRIEITPPKKCKKITGTRFGAILGLSPWSTSFKMWCEITKTYEEPFEDTIYTIAGKVIEPKQAEYMKRSYGMTLISPTDKYGENYFKQTRGDFFPENKHLGGMWDYLSVDENGNIDAVLEMKTSKRVEDWKDGVPEYYAVQASLYAYLLGVDKVIMVASFLEDKDYENPEAFVPSFHNTITREFRVSERYPNFKQMVKAVEQWWEYHVATGVSPEFDEKKDAEILKALRTNTLNPDTDIAELVKRAETLKTILDTITVSATETEKELKNVSDQIKAYALLQFREGDNKVEIKGSRLTFTLSKSVSNKFDDKAFKEANPEEYAKYIKPTETFRLTTSEIKEDK